MSDAEKLFATMRAEAARHGIELYALPDGAYLLARWGMHRELPDVQAVREMLARMGVPL